jgi:hypothetical protein
VTAGSLLRSLDSILPVRSLTDHPKKKKKKKKKKEKRKKKKVKE